MSVSSIPEGPLSLVVFLDLRAGQDTTHPEAHQTIPWDLSGGSQKQRIPKPTKQHNVRPCAVHGMPPTEAIPGAATEDNNSALHHNLGYQ